LNRINKKELDLKTKTTQGKEQDVIIEGLRKYGRRAYDTTLENGVAVTVLKGKKICRIDPSGEVSVEETMKKIRVKVSNRTFSLK
jgi:hypothetical protein